MTKMRSMLFLFAICTCTLSAYADITIINHTNSYGTARFDLSDCSSGPRGIVSPHGETVLTQQDMRLYCRNLACRAHVYASKDCSGEEIATVQVIARTSKVVVQHADTVHYVISVVGSMVTVDPVS